MTVSCPGTSQGFTSSGGRAGERWRRRGSRTGHRTWAGAGSRTTTPGWASPRLTRASHPLPSDVT